MNYAKATTEQELLDMVAYLESKGYEKDLLCLIGNLGKNLKYYPYVGISSIILVTNNENGTHLQGHEVSVSEFLKQ